MKKQLLFMAFIALVAMTFASCSSSDEAQNEQNQLKLSAGITAQREPYDINEWGTNIDIGDIDASAAKESKARVDKTLTRNTVDNDNWEGMSNRNIAVLAGGNVYQYEVDANGNLTSDSPYYFTTTNNVSVVSWYPYSASLSTFAIQTDQTSFANYEKSDLLYATATVNQSSPSAITYAHKTAKVIFRVTINNSQYLYDPTINGVTLSNVYYKGNVSNGNITATDKGTIKMYNNVASSTSASNVTTATFEACVVPQTTAISYVVTYGAETYSGSISSATLQAGRIYTCDITMNVQGSGTINGHTWVRLGVPGDIKWAQTNIGASTSSDYGNYYCWGAKAVYPSAFYTEFKDITPTSGYDTAREVWGGTWRMPTSDDFYNLYRYCTFSYTEVNGHNGYLMKSKRNNNEIFFPANGWYDNNSLHGVSSKVCYWSSTNFNNVDLAAHCFGWNIRNAMPYLDDDNNGASWRRQGMGIRPVSD